MAFFPTAELTRCPLFFVVSSYTRYTVRARFELRVIFFFFFSILPLRQTPKT